VGPSSAFLGSLSQSPMRSLRLSLLQVIEVAADHPDLSAFVIRQSDPEKRLDLFQKRNQSR
jgi:hypothetical protein